MEQGTESGEGQNTDRYQKGCLVTQQVWAGSQKHHQGRSEKFRFILVVFPT